jgi:hypothetical protein
MGLCQELEVLGCLGLLLVEVVGAEAGVALVDEDQCLLTCNSLAYLKLACCNWIQDSKAQSHVLDQISGSQSASRTKGPSKDSCREEDDERAGINNPLPHAFFREIRRTVVVPSMKTHREKR